MQPVEAKGMKAKDSKETVRDFLTMITKGESWPIEFWVNKWTEFAGEFEKLYKVEGTQIYSIMSETEAAFAERTIRALKHILYRYTDVFGFETEIYQGLWLRNLQYRRSQKGAQRRS